MSVLTRYGAGLKLLPGGVLIVDPAYIGGGSYTAGTGLVLVGSQFSVDYGVAAVWTNAALTTWQGPGAFSNGALTLLDFLGMGGALKGRDAAPGQSAYAIALVGGLGLAAFGATPGSPGGGVFATGNNGGDGTSTLAAGPGGPMQFFAGDAGKANGGPGANGGDWKADAGKGSGAGRAGVASLGTDSCSKVLLGHPGAPTEVQGALRADQDLQVASIDTSASPGDAMGINANAGRCAVASGSNVIHVSNNRVTAASHVFAQISQDAEDSSAKYVVRCAPFAGGFAIYLNAPASFNVLVDWFVVNP